MYRNKSKKGARMEQRLTKETKLCSDRVRSKKGTRKEAGK